MQLPINNEKTITYMKTAVNDQLQKTLENSNQN
jgi:hypothetical protein